MTNPREKGPSGQFWPSVSVVIPVRNEARAVVGAIESALAQDYPGSLDVVVADGDSVDGTREAVESIAKQGRPVNLINNRSAVTPAGLNAAIRASRGDVIVRCDAHSILPPTYVRDAVETLMATGADNVGGIQAAVGVTPVQRAIATAMSIPLGVGDARFHHDGPPGPVDTVYLGVFRKQVFEGVGLFDEQLLRNQDYELNYRIRKSGGIVYFDPRLKVEYRPRSSLRGLGRQYWRYGAGKRKVVGKHPRSLRLRQVAPPLAVLGLAFSILGGLFNPVWLVAPLLYATVLLVSAAWLSLRHRDLALLMVGPSLAVMHLAWGLGFLSVLPWRSSH